MKKLFTERMGQPQPRVKEFLDGKVRVALFQLVQQRIQGNSFGLSFPAYCPDGPINAGGNEQSLRACMDGFHVVWPEDVRMRDDEEVSEGQIFDLLEFSFEHVARPVPRSHHPFFAHHHYDYDQDAGRRQFADDVNRLFERNGVAFQLRDGQIERLVPTVLQDVLLQHAFNTRDRTLDELLGTAREKFLNRDLAVRREALEKLWDAWERLKSLTDPTDKKRSTKMLLDRGAAEPHLRERIEAEAKQLTDIGNEFMIRHTEINKVPLTESIHVDYLFHRLFSMIRLLLLA